MSRRSAMPLLIMLLTFFVAQGAEAQTSQRDKIQRRLDEVRQLMEEETGTIGILEKQLEKAIDSGNAAKIDKLREEVDASFDRVEELEDLEKQLQKLLGSAGGSRSVGDRKPRSRGNAAGNRIRGRGNSRVPQPTIGGLDPNGAFLDVDVDEAAEKAAEDRDRQNGRNRRGGGASDNRDRERNRDLSVDEQNIVHLKDAMAALEAAGEFGLARSVEALIRKAERDVTESDARERDKEKDRLRDRDRERERDTAGDRDRRPRGGGNRRPQPGAGGGVQGPVSAEGTPPQRRNDNSNDNDDEQANDLLDDLKDRLEKLKEKTKRDKDR